MTSAINLRIAFIAMLGALSLLVYGLMVPAAARADADGDAPTPPITSIGKIDVKYTAPAPKTELDEILSQVGLGPKKDEGRNITGWCTAWVVSVHDDTAYLMTAGHCTDVNSAAKSLGVENPQDVKMEITFTRADNVNGVAAENPRKAQFIDMMDPENGDLALLRIHKFDNEVLTPLPIASTPAVTGDNITATGFPKQPDEIHSTPNLLTTWGKVTSEVTSSDMNSMFYMTIQAPIGGGMSGGPVMSEDGVVGVISRGVPKSDLLQYVVDQENIERFLSANGIAMSQTFSASREQAKLQESLPKAKIHQAPPEVASQPVVLRREFDTDRISGWGKTYWQAQVDTYRMAERNATSPLGIGIIAGTILLGLILLIQRGRHTSVPTSGGRHRRQ